MSEREMWRVVLENGLTCSVVVCRQNGGFRASCGGDRGGIGSTPRGAIVQLAAMMPHGGGIGWPVVETLAPGERSRAKIEADEARVTASLATAEAASLKATRRAYAIRNTVAAACEDRAAEMGAMARRTGDGDAVVLEMKMADLAAEIRGMRIPETETV